MRLREELKGSGLRLLYDELEFDPAFEKVVRFSTRNVLVCECQEFAANVAYGRLDGQRYSVVSLNGRFFQGNGLVSGTSQYDLSRSPLIRWTNSVVLQGHGEEGETVGQEGGSGS